PRRPSHGNAVRPRGHARRWRGDHRRRKRRHLVSELLDRPRTSHVRQRVTKRAYLLGQPVAHSLSPTLHNAAFAALGVDGVYSAIEVTLADLPIVVQSLRAPDCYGANVTAPHKRNVMEYLDAIG